LLLFAYFIGSAQRLADNPNDKLLPSATQMIAAVDRLALPKTSAAANTCSGRTPPPALNDWPWAWYRRHSRLVL
jgi:hypothetical protein